MNRHALDAFTRRHRLAPATIEVALRLTGLRPGAAAWRAVGASLLRAAGIGALGAGLLFFIAANWQDWGPVGRMALLQSALLACIGAAIWRPPPSLPGQGALILATLSTGGLLALFGQSYQTGADVYELFFSWAALALPFAIAGLSGALWAVWWVVLNLGLALLCGVTGSDDFVWRLFDSRALDRSTMLMLPCVVNLLGAGVFLRLRRTRLAAAAPMWLVRGLAAAGFAYGTLAVVMALYGRSGTDFGSGTGAHAAVGWVFAALSAGIALAAWRVKRDVFPMALVSAAWIAISIAWLLRGTNLNDTPMFLLIAGWLVVTSTGSGLLLMHWVRAWQAAPRSLTGGQAA